MKSSEAKLILKVFNSNASSTNEEICKAYSFLPNVPQMEFAVMKKIHAINRYATFNREELDYAIANSNETIDELQEERFKAVTPTIDEEIMATILVNEQTGAGEQVGEYQLEKPATKKHKGGRPKGSKAKVK